MTAPHRRSADAVVITINARTMEDAHGNLYALEAHDYFLRDICDECAVNGERRGGCNCLDEFCAECDGPITDGEQYAVCLDGADSFCSDCYELV